ncbi:hypothetical protein CMO93_04405 [Candidatus Woesearchaeota archaeon]|nr:hypothetical protein [Candidatus Woesearchaeota archaeon]|tara:strand:+ start:74 stop:940 length:867 start_codon:yes stop_codon:yes gene_type:complete
MGLICHRSKVYVPYEVFAFGLNDDEDNDNKNCMGVLFPDRYKELSQKEILDKVSDAAGGYIKQRTFPPGLKRFEVIYSTDEGIRTARQLAEKKGCVWSALVNIVEEKYDKKSYDYVRILYAKVSEAALEGVSEMNVESYHDMVKKQTTETEGKYGYKTESIIRLEDGHWPERETIDVLVESGTSRSYILKVKPVRYSPEKMRLVVNPVRYPRKEMRGVISELYRNLPDEEQIAKLTNVSDQHLITIMDRLLIRIIRMVFERRIDIMPGETVGFHDRPDTPSVDKRKWH